MVSRPVRLGTVCYLNAAPLVHGLRGDPRFEVVPDLPSRVADALHRGEVDLGLIPSIEYAAGRYVVVPGVAVASRGPVRSVSLYHRRPLAEVARVALDTSSRTSVALARVLLRERLGRDPDYVARPPDLEAMLEEADAALVIGDPALYSESSVPRLDLGAAWTEATRLPFVYAFWAGREEAITDDVVTRLREAAEQGKGALGQVASTYNGQGAGRHGLNESYLRENIVYDFGEAEQSGLRAFYARAHRLGLIAEAPELRFHGRP